LAQSMKLPIAGGRIGTRVGSAVLWFGPGTACHHLREARLGTGRYELAAAELEPVPIPTTSYAIVAPSREVAVSRSVMTIGSPPLAVRRFVAGGGVPRYQRQQAAARAGHARNRRRARPRARDSRSHAAHRARPPASRLAAAPPCWTSRASLGGAVAPCTTGRTPAPRHDGGEAALLLLSQRCEQPLAVETNIAQGGMVCQRQQQVLGLNDVLASTQHLLTRPRKLTTSAPRTRNACSTVGTMSNCWRSLPTRDASWERLA
jgi:hypothetical protein